MLDTYSRALFVHEISQKCDEYIDLIETLLTSKK